MDAQIEKVMRCRKCYRSGMVTWEMAPSGGKVLVALPEGFHRRPRIPLNLPPDIVCDCGTVQPN
jgi:hypothetical protein